MYNEPKKTKDKLTILVYSLFFLSTLCKWDSTLTLGPYLLSSYNVLHVHTLNVLQLCEVWDEGRSGPFDLHCKLCIPRNLRMLVHLRTYSANCSDVRVTFRYSSLGTCTRNSLRSKIYQTAKIVSPQSKRKCFRNSNAGYPSSCWLLSLAWSASTYGSYSWI